MAKRARRNLDRGSRRAGKGRIPLTPREILQLDAALVQAFRTIQRLRKQNDAAKHIQFPPLPSIFSESIVIASSERLFGPGWSAMSGGMECDVRLANADGDQKRVEVKATGEHAFQEFKSKDLRADILVWIRFGRRFQEGRGPIEIVLLAQPGRFVKTPCRLDAVRFERLVGSTGSLKVLTFGSLETLLVGNPAAQR